MKTEQIYEPFKQFKNASVTMPDHFVNLNKMINLAIR